MARFFFPRPEGTIKAAEDFDPERACQLLQKSFKGIGTDEKTIIEVLTSHNSEQRQEIIKLYKGMYGKDLIEDIKGELGGNFEEVTLALLQEPEEYLVECLRETMKGLGTDEYSLIGIICCRTNPELEAIKEAYKEKYETDLEEDIKGDLSGDFCNLMVALITAAREEDEEVNEDRAKEDAQAMQEAGLGMGTEESVFNAILCTRSYPQLRETFKAYEELSGNDFEEGIRSEFSGNMQDGLLAIVQVVKNMPTFFAERLHKAIKGAGTDDPTMIRIIVTRSEIDLEDIKSEYQNMYEKELTDSVAGDTDGDYRKILLSLLGQE